MFDTAHLHGSASVPYKGQRSITELWDGCEAIIPVTDLKGDLLLSGESSFSFSPNGHGGALKALLDSGVISKFISAGIKHLSYHQVDNPLYNLLDPLFIGLHDLQNSDISSRSLTKNDPFEKLGNFVTTGELLTIIEYSDFPANEAVKTLDNGELKYRAGSPAMHLFRCDFITQFKDSKLRLPYHKALKKVSFFDGFNVVDPIKENAIKSENFIFDALPLAKKTLVLEASRADLFAPVKNRTGIDSLESSIQAQLNRSEKWLKCSGVNIPAGAQVELSPYSYHSQSDLMTKTFPRFTENSLNVIE